MRRTQKIVVPGTFPSLNEIIGLIFMPPKGEITFSKGLKGMFQWINYAKEIYKNRKSKLEERVHWAAVISGAVPIEEACSMVFVWYEKDRRRDHDNIASAVKFILDGLRGCRIFGNDGWKHVSGGFVHKFAVDKGNPRIEIYILEAQPIDLDLDDLNSRVVNKSREVKPKIA